MSSRITLSVSLKNHNKKVELLKSNPTLYFLSVNKKINLLLPLPFFSPVLLLLFLTLLEKIVHHYDKILQNQG